MACEPCRRRVRLDHAEHPQALLAVALSCEQPSRALGDAEAEERVDDRRDRGDAEHPPPRVLADAGEHRVRRERHEDAEHDVELEHAGEPAAVRRRRDLGDVERRRDGRDADPEAADEPRGDERAYAAGEGAAERGDHVEDADPEEGRPAPEAVGGPAADEGADDGAVKRRSHRDAVHLRAEAPERLDRLLRAGDHDGVEAEQEAREGRGDGPEERAPLHAQVLPETTRGREWKGARDGRGNRHSRSRPAGNPLPALLLPGSGEIADAVLPGAAATRPSRAGEGAVRGEGVMTLKQGTSAFSCVPMVAVLAVAATIPAVAEDRPAGSIPGVAAWLAGDARAGRRRARVAERPRGRPRSRGGPPLRGRGRGGRARARGAARPGAAVAARAALAGPGESRDGEPAPRGDARRSRRGSGGGQPRLPLARASPPRRDERGPRARAAARGGVARAGPVPRLAVARRRRGGARQRGRRGRGLAAGAGAVPGRRRAAAPRRGQHPRGPDGGGAAVARGSALDP